MAFWPNSPSILLSRSSVPRLVDAEGRPELSFGPMIGPINEIRQQWRAARNVTNLTAARTYPDWVSGACLLVRRADADAVGLLDERFFMYTEDVDFCASIRARGRRILFTPDVEVVHLRGRSRASAPTATERAYRRSQIAFYEKHHPAWMPLLEGLPHAARARLMAKTEREWRCSEPCWPLRPASRCTRRTSARNRLLRHLAEQAAIDAAIDEALKEPTPAKPAPAPSAIEPTTTNPSPTVGSFSAIARGIGPAIDARSRARRNPRRIRLGLFHQARYAADQRLTSSARRSYGGTPHAE